MNTTNWIIAGIIFLIIAAAIYYAGWHMKPVPKLIPKDSVATNIEIKTKPDSLYQAPVIVKADTTKVDSTYIAVKDTSIGDVKIHLEYRSLQPIPEGEFWADLPIITKTIMVEKSIPFYQTFTAGIVVGVVAVLVIVWLVGQII